MGTMRPKRLAVFVFVFGLGGCATARNYPDPAGPRFAGQFAGTVAPRSIRVVSFNVKYGRNVTGAGSVRRTRRGCGIMGRQWCHDEEDAT